MFNPTMNSDNQAILAAIMGAGAAEPTTTFNTGLGVNPLGAQQTPLFGAQQPQQPPQQTNTSTFTDTLARFFAGPNSTFGQVQNKHRSPVGSSGLSSDLRIPPEHRIFPDGSKF